MTRLQRLPNAAALSTTKLPSYITNKFHNKERLKSRKEIGRLFGKDGQSVNSYPIRLAYVEAVQKSIIGAHTEGAVAPAKQHALLFIYTGKEEMDFRYLEKKMRKVLGQLVEKLQLDS